MISVIIPVYNNPKLLRKTLKSLDGQTYKFFEVIVVDDGSQPEININYKGDLNIQFFRIEHGGAPKARNFGFAKSTGDYVLFCDADLKLKPTCLAKMKKSLEENLDCSFAYSDFKYGWKNFKFWKFDLDKLKEINYINTCSLLHRDVFPGFDESLAKFQDWDLWLSICLKGAKGTYIPEVLFKAYVGKGVISHWLPKAVYKMPFLKSKKIDRYNHWQKIIKKKHHLN